MSNRKLVGCYVSLYDYEHTGHPQKYMKSLGIDVGLAVPQSLYDSWQFFMCSNVPDPLPEYITEMKPFNPLDYVGHGLSQEDAEKIIHWMVENQIEVPPRKA